MKANFTGTSYNISIFNQKEKQITSSMFMQSLHCSGYHLLESTPLHELLTQQKHDHLPLLHFFFPSTFHSFQIARLMSLLNMCMNYMVSVLNTM